MGREIIKPSAEKESAEARNFGTDLNAQEMSSMFSTTPIVAQAQANFTDFLRYECAACKKTIRHETAAAVGDGWACADCLKNLTETALGVLKVGADRQRKAVRLFECFGCGGHFAAQKMSGLLVICRQCRKTASGDDTREQKRFVEKTLRRIGRFLGGRL